MRPRGEFGGRRGALAEESLAGGAHDTGSVDAGLAEGGGMAHLAACAGLFFAVKVKLDLGELEHGGPIGVGLPEVAEEVGHGCRRVELSAAQRQTANRTELLLELTGRAGVDR